MRRSPKWRLRSAPGPCVGQRDGLRGRELPCSRRGKAERSRAQSIGRRGGAGPAQRHRLGSGSIGKVSVPVAAPGCVGANSTCTWQLEFAARVTAPQELLEIVN